MAFLAAGIAKTLAGLAIAEAPQEVLFFRGNHMTDNSEIEELSIKLRKETL